MHRITVVVLLLLAFPCVSSSDEWYKVYESGKQKAEKNQCEQAEKLLLNAIAINPKPDLRARPYGTITMEYIPQYFLERCSFQKGNLEQAKKYLNEALSGGIEKSSKADEFRVLNNRLTAKLNENAQQP